MVTIYFLAVMLLLALSIAGILGLVVHGMKLLVVYIIDKVSNGNHP